MPPLRVLVIPVGVAAALIGTAAFAASATSSGTGAEPSRYVYRGPVASASGGGGAPPAIPSIVDVWLSRAESALQSAGTYVDQGEPSLASGPLLSARANMRKAWKAAKYVVQTAPPPPVAGDGAYAHSSGGAPVGGYATPQDSVFAVLGLQHDVATGSAALMGTGNAALEANLTATIRAAVNGQDRAVAYVHTIAPPAPPGWGRPREVGWWGDRGHMGLDHAAGASGPRRRDPGSEGGQLCHAPLDDNQVVPQAHGAPRPRHQGHHQPVLAAGRRGRLTGLLDQQPGAVVPSDDWESRRTGSNRQELYEAGEATTCGRCWPGRGRAGGRCGARQARGRRRRRDATSRPGPGDSRPSSTSRSTPSEGRSSYLLGFRSAIRNVGDGPLVIQGNRFEQGISNHGRRPAGRDRDRVHESSARCRRARLHDLAGPRPLAPGRLRPLRAASGRHCSDARPGSQERLLPRRSLPGHHPRGDRRGGNARVHRSLRARSSRPDGDHRRHLSRVRRRLPRLPGDPAASAGRPP